MTTNVIDFQQFRNARLATTGTVAQPTAQVAAAAAVASSKYTPAYSDPSNLQVGSKFVRGRDTAEIAKLIRAEIATAIKIGAMPKIKASVKTGRSSMSSSITICITEVPSDFVRYQNEYIRAHVRNESPCVKRHTREAESVLDLIDMIAKQYHWSNSSPGDDYSHVNFYLAVQFDGAVGREQWKAVEAQVRAERGY